MGIYVAPPGGPALFQGEVLRNLVVLIPDRHSLQPGAVTFRPEVHPLAVLVHPDCDLDRDHKGRTSTTEPVNSALLSQVLLCPAYNQDEIRAENSYFGTRDFKQIRQNQNERFHCLPAGQIGDGPASLEEMFVDFRHAMGVPTELLYEAVAAQTTERLALVNDVFRHDLIQRFCSYLGRVALPD